MDNLQESIYEAIKKSLPSLQATAIIESLQETERLRKQNQSLEEKLVTSQKQCEKLQNSVKDVELREKELANKENELATKEILLNNKVIEIESQERNIEMIKLTIRLESEMKRNDDLYNITAQVFKSPIVKNDGFLSSVDSNGNWRNLPFLQHTEQQDQIAPIHRHTIDSGMPVTGNNPIP